MSPLRDHLVRLDRGRAMAWAAVLEREFPGIGNQPNRVQGLVALKPYLNPDPRPAVGTFVDGKAYVIVDQRPDLFPVIDDHVYESRSGGDLHVLTINSYKWRQYSMILVDGWTTPDTFSAAIRGSAGPPDGGWWPADKETMGTQIPLVLQPRLHVAIWAVAVLVLMGSLTSVPTGSPDNLPIALLLGTAFIGLVVISVTTFLPWLLRRWHS